MDYGTCDYNANNHQDKQEIEFLKNKVKELTDRNEKLKEELNKQHRMYGSWSISYKEYAAAMGRDEIAKLKNENIKLKDELDRLERQYKVLNGAYDCVSNQVTVWYKRYIECKNVCPDIKNVIFNDPATIVFWKDGTKTVVKAQGDDMFDPEKGLAMAYFKKSKGNTGKYYDEVKKWVEPYQKENEKIAKGIFDALIDIFKSAEHKVNKEDIKDIPLKSDEEEATTEE